MGPSLLRVKCFFKAFPEGADVSGGESEDVAPTPQHSILQKLVFSQPVFKAFVNL